MSFHVEICIDYDGKLEMLKEQIASIIGGKFYPIEEEVGWQKSFLGMWFELTENDFENDGDVDFENYPFVLSSRTSAGTPLKTIRKLQIPITDLIAQLICLALKVEVMVVIDTQEVYAKYHPKKIVPEPRVWNETTEQSTTEKLTELGLE